MKAVLRESLPPHFARFTDDTRQLLKRAIAFYIHQPGFDFLDFWNGYLPAFSAPGKQILIWIWETLFPGESAERLAKDCVEDRTVTAEEFVHYKKPTSQA